MGSAYASIETSSRIVRLPLPAILARGSVPGGSSVFVRCLAIIGQSVFALPPIRYTSVRTLRRWSRL